MPLGGMALIPRTGAVVPVALPVAGYGLAAEGADRVNLACRSVQVDSMSLFMHAVQRAGWRGHGQSSTEEENRSLQHRAIERIKS